MGEPNARQDSGAYTVWLTGLPCSGKTTIGRRLAPMLGAYLLDGDSFRKTAFACDLGFTPQDRETNLRRAATLCRTLNDTGTPVVACFVSPREAMRLAVRDIIGPERISIVWVKCSPEECERRDVKGMWAQARAGGLPRFTGVDAPFERPVARSYGVDTEANSVGDCVQSIARAIINKWQMPVRRHVYIGRWSPFHDGHKAIIDRKLAEGKPVLILVRDRAVTRDDPFTAPERRAMIEAVYPGRTQVEVRVIPDVESVVIGRAVGYGVEEVDVPPDVQAISGTAVRESLRRGNGDWRNDVPRQVAAWLDNREA